jgi:threonine/homoserine/homoserine lactone efflux protein
MWIEIILLTLTSFVVGLSGAIVPGPMLTVTISDSIKKGFTTGPKVVIGHFIVELLLIILLFAGLGWFIDSSLAIFIIGTLGGIVMMILGLRLIKSSNSLNLLREESDTKKDFGPVLNGILTSISNPYFFIWWATIGWTFMFKGLEIAGILGVLSFLVGHWCSEMGWFSMVSLFTSKGSDIMTENHYKIIIISSGLFLMILGLYFVLNAQKII